MFYETAKNDHGLPRDPFKAIVVPRPIGWLTSVSAKGEINLAPYSFFNAVSEHPPMVMFSSGGRKDTIAFVEETKEFVCNFANFALREAVSTSGTEFPRGVNEMIEAGLEPAPSRLVRPPRVAASPCALECKLLRIVDLTDLDGRHLAALRRVRAGGRRLYRRPLHQGRQARYRRHAADRALRLQRLRGGR